MGGDFVELVISMNKSWSEFEDAYGIHVARRIAEMCVRIDFDKTTVTEPLADPNMPDAIDLALEGVFGSVIQPGQHVRIRTGPERELPNFGDETLEETVDEIGESDY